MRINALILDDNWIVGDCIKKRIFKANEAEFSSEEINVKPFYLEVDTLDKENAARIIESFIINNEINFLLLDRGFYNLIDPKSLVGHENLQPEKLYLNKKDKGIKIEQILKCISKDKMKSLKGVIIYTYDMEGTYIEPAQIRQNILEILPITFKKENIDIVLTNSEIYSLSSLQLYGNEADKNNPELIISGTKSDFMLYGLFIGEILYHRIISIVQKEREIQKINKKQRVTIQQS